MAIEKIRVRNYDWKIDRVGVEDLERRCEVGLMQHFFLFSDNLGDPISRIRNCPMYTMLVAELSNEIVGVIQGTIKLVTLKDHLANVGYVLGLRVSPVHRRKGIALTLVRQMEAWFVARQADYAYTAMEKDNDASTNLFMNRLGYVKFRSPSILVNPVLTTALRLSSEVVIAQLKIPHAEFLYRKFMSSTEFFPQDIHMILNNKLSFGTWMAYYNKGEAFNISENGDFESLLPRSWAMLSVWKSSEVFKLRVGNPTSSCMAYSESTRMMNKVFPCFKASGIPDFYDPFGFLFAYGIYRKGPCSGKLVRGLCKFVHNLALECCKDCKLIVTEVGGGDRVKMHIPHWKLLWCPEDLWCIKPLKYQEKGNLDELTKTLPKTRSLFVDPREV